MGLIKDIRLFESDVPNIDGEPAPSYIGKIYRYDSMDCLDVIQRLLFLLRHRGFGYEGFDHLYLALTPCIPHGDIRDVDRYQIREFSWYHYVDIGCDVDLFSGWELADKTSFILQAVKDASVMKASEKQKALFSDTFDEVLQMGERLLLPYKQKESECYVVEVFTRVTDELDLLPLVRISDKEGNVIAERQLRSYGRDEFICQIGTITIGKRSVRIVPRKNWYTEVYDLKPIKIEW